MTPSLFDKFPKNRPALDERYQQIYRQEYTRSREGLSFINDLAQRAESWMHRIASREKAGRVLEIGAGSLNHFKYETCKSYEIVEPMKFLYQDKNELQYIEKIYSDISEIKPDIHYDKIVSIATFEHIRDLPFAVARGGTLLADDGFLACGIPTEGGFLWGASWRMTTGLVFRIRTGLSYKKIMDHEHLNNAAEIESIIRYFFDDVTICRFPLNLKHLSLFTFLSARKPKVNLCHEFLANYEG